MKKILMLCVFALLLVSVSAGFAESALNPIGTLSESNYENAFFGVGCSFPDWVLSAPDGSEVNAQLAQGYAKILEGISANQFNMMQVLILDTTADDTIPETTEGVLQKLGDELIESLAAYGLKFKPMEVGSYTLSGREESSGFCKGTVNNGTSSAYLRMIAIKKDQYILLINGVSAGSNKTDEILSHFYRLEQ